MRRAVVGPSTSPRVSRSTRTTCWRWATMRVLMLVARLAQASRPAQLTPSRESNSWSRPASASCPETPSNSVATPRWARLRATLPAPPGMKLSRSNSTTGTGASGEMRATLPQRNWSSITSPRTMTRARPAAESNSARARDNGRFLLSWYVCEKKAAQVSSARKAVSGLVGLAVVCGAGRPIS